MKAAMTSGSKRIEEPLKISRVTSAFVFSEKSGEE